MCEKRKCSKFGLLVREGCKNREICHTGSSRIRISRLILSSTSSTSREIIAHGEPKSRSARKSVSEAAKLARRSLARTCYAATATM